MTSKPRVLFLVFEALLDTVIYSQVLDHVRELSEAGVAEFEVWALPCDERGYAHSLQQLERAKQRAGCPVRVFRGVRPASPLSVRRNARVLDEALARVSQTFTQIHARGDYAVQVAASLSKLRGVPILWDCRGDAAAEVDYRADLASFKGVGAPLLRRLLRARMRRAARLCARALFVSAPLCALVAAELGGKPHAVIPCCADEKQFFFDESLREQARNKLGYSPDDVVFAYVGTLHRYQRFDDTVAAFDRYRKRNPRARLLIVTPQADAARTVLNLLPEELWTLVSAKFEDVNGYLNAADAGFLLRDATPTNRVASPTKFAEYGLTGLPVVMTDAIPDSCRLAREAGNLVAFDEGSGEIGDIPAIDRPAIARHYRGVLSKRSALPAYREIYRSE